MAKTTYHTRKNGLKQKYFTCWKIQWAADEINELLKFKIAQSILHLILFVCDLKVLNYEWNSQAMT
jgi:hypothetical protein